MVKYSAIWWFGNLMRQWFCFANQIFIFGLLEFIFDELMKQASLVVKINRYLAIKIIPAALINESSKSNVALLKVCRLKILSSSQSWRPKESKLLFVHRIVTIFQQPRFTSRVTKTSEQSQPEPSQTLAGGLYYKHHTVHTFLDSSCGTIQMRAIQDCTCL